MGPSNHTDEGERGFIIPIGGAEEKLHNPEILDSFVEVCGGRSARIAIIPTASELEDTGRTYEKLFRKLGIKHVRVLQMQMREDCHSQKFLDYIEGAQGVFMTGGNQLRLSTTLGGKGAHLRSRIGQRSNRRRRKKHEAHPVNPGHQRTMLEH